MDIVLLLIGLILMLVGILGSFLPVLPGPPVSWVGLLLLYLTKAIPDDWWLLGITAGIALIVFLYIVTESCDSFALLIGKLFGRHKAFRISPNKTLEGLAAGIVLAAAIGSVIGHALGWSWLVSTPPTTGPVAAATLPIAAVMPKTWAR